MNIHDRINRVINTAAFEKALEDADVCLFEFQCEWPKHERFEDLPKAFQAAIEAGEAELLQGQLTVA